MKHKHAELIKAWADGAEILQYMINLDEWADCTYDPSWNVNKTYRIKPEPKPDVIRFVRAINGNEKIKFIFDGETGDLKSAEVIK